MQSERSELWEMQDPDVPECAHPRCSADGTTACDVCGGIFCALHMNPDGEGSNLCDACVMVAAGDDEDVSEEAEVTA